MKFENSSALNIIYLLLDFYKTLGLKEREVMVILMINQLLTQGNDFITSDVLSLKMNLTMNEIDESLSILFTKKYIEFEEHNNTLTTSIEPIKKILIKLFEKSIFSDEEYQQNEELEAKRELIFNRIQEAFNRSLSPIEINKVDKWIMDNVPVDVILDSLKDSVRANKFSITYMDKIIINKMKEEDLDGNRIKS